MISSFIEQLESMWCSTAAQMSYYNADDTGVEWKHARALSPLLLEIERQIKSYGGSRPDPEGYYLLGMDDRIEWI